MANEFAKCQRGVNMDSFERLLSFLSRLDGAHINYSLEHHRDGAIMVLVAVPGERWEVEFFQDGAVEVELFKSAGEINGEEKLDELFAKFSD